MSNDPTCSVQVAAAIYSDDGNTVTWGTERCGEALFIERSEFFDLGAGTTVADLEPGEGSSSSWRVICVDRHVLMWDGGDPDDPRPITDEMLADMKRLSDPTPLQVKLKEER